MTCYSVINEECSKNAHDYLGLDFEQTQQCVTESFSKPTNWQSSSVKNSVIASEIQLWKEHGTNTYPALRINNNVYRGQIEPYTVLSAICASFTEPPSECLPALGLQS